MQASVNNLLRRFSVQQLIGTTVSVGILLLALASTIVISRQSGDTVKHRLTEEGLQLADSLGVQSTLPLLYESSESAEETVRAFLAFPDVAAIELTNLDGERIFIGSSAGDSRGSDSLLIRPLGERPLAATMRYEDDHYWEFATPVFFGGEDSNPFGTEAEADRELLGHARLLMGKQTLRHMEQEIFRSNLLVSTGFAVLLLLVLLMLTNRITVPVQRLGNIMRRAEQGEKDVRAPLLGTRDIVDMEQAFNTMMDVLDTREQALKTARDQALESARAKSDFAATVSHELRTPLNGVIGMLELISEMNLDSKQSEYVHTARSSADMLLTLIDDILTFSKNDAGKASLEVREFGVREGLEEIVTLVAAQAQAKNLEIACIVDENVPGVLLGDFDRLRQVLINLLGNAVKFTSEGEVSLTISIIEDSADSASVQFDVIDTGIGIDEIARQRIFDAFSQADASTTRQFGGTGLGLAISRQLMQLMGGEIGVDSEPGEGSHFWLRLPLLKQHRGSTPLRSVLPLPRLASVLLCDDSPLVGRSLASMLTGEQVRLDLAGSCEAAAVKLRQAQERQQHYDIVLLDECLQNVNGDDEAESIIHLCEDQPGHLVLLTQGMRAVNRETRSRQHVPNLVKPLRKSALMDCLKLLLTDSSRKVREVRRRPEYQGEDFAGAHILVVEDNRANQDVARGMLERLGCDAIVAADGVECIEALRGDKFDLILMDCQMPRMDGFEATRRIRDMASPICELPIIAMTANVQRGAVESCEAAGMNDYLAKPVKLSVLKGTLGRWLALAKPAPQEDAASPETVQASDSVMDREFIDSLAEQLGEEATERLLNTVAEDAPVFLRELENASREGRLAAVADTAHKFKGSAVNVGAKRLADSLQRLETAARASHGGPVDGLLADTCYEAGLLQRVLDARLSLGSKDKASNISNSAQGGAASARILLVDDDRGSRFALREVLIAAGHEIVEAENGQLALELCREQLPELILMDARMPVMDGLTACRLIRELPDSDTVQILVITGLNDEQTINDAFTAGANDYISKPINYGVLKKRVDRLLMTSHSERHVRELAYVDTLTGLPNRSLFNEHIGKLLSSTTREDSPFALLLLDLDRFKLVNDSMGHEAGDLLLKYFAERIQGCLRKGDMVARFGGDEFCVILDRIKSYDIVESITEKIHDHLSRPFAFMKKEMYITTSIGVAVYPEHGKDVSTLMRNADMAMYRAKETGNRCQFYQRDFESAMVHRMEMESALRNAIERDELMVYYQPQLDLKTEEINSMEALIRWNHPERGLVSPVEFIYLAEETGLIVEIGHWVLCHVCEQIACWIKEGYDAPRVAVNLSARQLNSAELIDMIAGVVEETGIPSSLIELEITESTIMDNPEDVIHTLHRLKDMGFTLAIDDFGTGYSSLNYLKRFPIDYIKIDRAFVIDVVDNRIDADIVRAIVALARALDVKVIAEGVETQDQQQFLQELDCDLSQGYLLSKPVPAGAIERQFLKYASESKLLAFPRQS